MQGGKALGLPPKGQHPRRNAHGRKTSNAPNASISGPVRGCLDQRHDESAITETPRRRHSRSKSAPQPIRSSCKAELPAPEPSFVPYGLQSPKPQHGEDRTGRVQKPGKLADAQPRILATPSFHVCHISRLPRFLSDQISAGRRLVFVAPGLIPLCPPCAPVHKSRHCGGHLFRQRAIRLINGGQCRCSRPLPMCPQSSLAIWPWICCSTILLAWIRADLWDAGYRCC